MSRRTVLGVVGALLALVAILVLSRPTLDPYERDPLDPRGTNPDGTAALVELLRGRGITVRIGGLPAESDEVTLTLRDTLSGRSADRLTEWVEAGGRLVTTDPFSGPGADAAAESSLGATHDRPGACSIDALSGLGRIGDMELLFAPGEGAATCVAPDAESAAAIHVRTAGEGAVVTLSTPSPLVNANLADRDNAALALLLLRPEEGSVRILDPNRLLGDADDVGDGTVLGALPRRGRQALTQLVLAFVVWGLVRGRRLGAPVREDLPVPLPASDLVLATGRLLDRNADPADAAERLRRRARRHLGTRTGLGPDPDPRELSDLLVGRVGLPPDVVAAALLTPVTDEAGLVSTSAHIDHLLQELHR